MSDSTFELVACRRDGSLSSLCTRTREIDQACAATVSMYEKLGFDPPWIGYIAVASGVAVGGGAFVGSPINNRAEIAYFTLPEHQRTGFATQTAKCLVDIARKHTPGIELYAKTLPNENASTRILNTLGFQLVGIEVDHEIGEAWAWLLQRHSANS